MKLKAYFLSTRPQFFPAIVLPVALGAAIAWRNNGLFNFWIFLLTLIAGILYHAGMNAFNDYFDFLNNADNLNENALTPFAGGSRLIQNKLMSPKETLGVAIALITAGSAVGLYLAFKTTPFLLAIGSIGLFTGFFYSAPPLFLAGRGLGELTVFLNFGALSVLGSYMAQTKTFAVEPLLASLPVSFLIAGVLLINEFPDRDSDEAAGKRTLAVRFGLERARYLLIAIIGLGCISVLAGIASGVLPKISVITLLALLFATPAAAGTFINTGAVKNLLTPMKMMVLAHFFTGALLTVSFLI